MLGINESIAQHKLGIDPNHMPTLQKKRHFTPEQHPAIDEEVDKLIKADFIFNIQYRDWFSNVVMVKKSKDNWRIFIDYTYLNKAFPKDCYLFPDIDQLIDVTVGHELLSFMDTFSGYNKI